MVTANLNYEQRPSSDVDGEEDENSSRHTLKRLVSLFVTDLFFLFLLFLSLFRFRIIYTWIILNTPVRNINTHKKQ